MTMAFAESGGKSMDDYLLDPIEMQALNVLPMPVVVVGEGHGILYANTAAEDFFQSSAVVLKRQRIDDLIAFGSPVLALVEEVQRRGSSVSEYRLDLGSPRLDEATREKLVDGITAETRGRDVLELEAMRDDGLIAVQRALKGRRF